MEKVNLYVKKILALTLSFSLFLLAPRLGIPSTPTTLLWLVPLAFLVFAFLDFRITGEKPRFLFGLSSSDTFLNQKGGFWNLFKWIVTTLGFVYDLLIWVVWGVYLLFLLVIDFLLLIKTIIFWIIHAIIWFIRQLFPPFIFLFKIFMHYVIHWPWWIYQVTVRNVRMSVRKSFYFIALWGTIPALFIVFLFYAIGQITGMPELVVVSGVFALVPLVWSYGEIAAVRFENREEEEYSSIATKFRNGFDAVRSILFYLILIVGLMVVEIVLNMVGWIPNLSMDFLGIAININMAISLVLLFLAIIIAFAGMILPTHILYKPEHENDLNSSLNLLAVIGRRFLRYTVSRIPVTFFGSILIVIPVLVIALSFSAMDSVKDRVLDVNIERIESMQFTDPAVDHKMEIRADRMKMYQEVPLLSPDHFASLRGNASRNQEMEYSIEAAKVFKDSINGLFSAEIALQSSKIKAAEAANGDTVNSDLLYMREQHKEMKQAAFDFDSTQALKITHKELELQESKRRGAQYPLLYFFVGIFFAVFGGLALAIFVAYTGNVNFELYNMREEGNPTFWMQTIQELKEKNGNQPLLGFTFLALLIPIVLTLLGVLALI